MKPLTHSYNARVAAVILLAATSFPIELEAASIDYSKIKRDINVMTQVIKGAFESAEECTDCKIKIKSHYLASQGAVFSITPSRGFSFMFNDRNFNFHIPEFSDRPVRRDMESTPDGNDLPGMVEGIVEGVELSLAGLSDAISSDNPGDRTDTYTTEASRRGALRELRRSERELRNKIREYEIELFKEEDEGKIREIDAKVEKLNSQLKAVISKKEQSRLEMENERHITIKKQEEKRAKTQQQEQMRYQQVEEIALGAFCDYGSMLKNLPSTEYVNIIFEGAKKDGKSDQIYVLKKSDLSNCSDRKALIQQAIRYEF